MPNLIEAAFRIIEITRDAADDILKFSVISAFCWGLYVGAALLVGGA